MPRRSIIGCDLHPFVAIAAALLLGDGQATAQMSPSFLRQVPAPITEVDVQPVLMIEGLDLAPQAVYPDTVTPLIRTTYAARAAAVFDSTRLANFAGGTFTPSAIPAEGEAFFNFGQRAMLQGSGSAIRIAAHPTARDPNIYAEALFIVEDLGTPVLDSPGISSRAHVQYNQLVVGLTETAFANPYVTVPTLDLVGPNATATVLSRSGGDGQGRLSYNHVNLKPVSGQLDKVYRRGNYAVINLINRQERQPGDGNNFWFSGIEYLYGDKLTVDRSSGHAHRFMFVTGILN